MNRLPYFTSVTWRMRAGLLFICALLISVLAVSAIGLFEVRRSQHDLSSGAIPALEQVQEVSKSLSVLDLALHDIDTAKTLGEHKRSVETASTAIEMFASLSAADPRSAPLRDGLIQFISRIDAIGRQSLLFSARIDVLGEEVDAKIQALAGLIEVLVLSNGARLETLARKSADPAEIEDFAAIATRQNRLTEFSYTIEKSADLANALKNARGLATINTAEERLAFTLRKAVISLGHLASVENGAEFARRVADLRKALLGEDWLVDLGRRRVEARQALRAELRRKEVRIAEFTNETSAGVLEARRKIGETAEAVDQTVANSLWRLGALGIAVVVLTGLVVIILIERQIIRRLAQLTRSVRAIAAGDNKSEVAVSGDDEFGEMAAALELLKTNSKELHRSNAELAKFAYAASHDLRSPLNGIRDLAHWTIEDAGEHLPADCRTNLDMLMNRVDRLSDLLGSLLTFSKVGGEDSQIEEVRLADLPGELLEILGASDRFELETTGDVEPIQTYAAPFRQIVLNLINNAIKHHDRGTGRLLVEYRRDGDRIHVSVIDDGPGVDPAFHDRIFGLFETLRSRDDVEGSGMGLAIVRKQVEHFDGEITVSSQPDRNRGAAFCFDWPVHGDETREKQLAA